MKSRTFRKIAALVIVLTMVLSVAGVSMATSVPSKADIVYDLAGGSMNGSTAGWTDHVSVYNQQWYYGDYIGYRSFSLPTVAPTKAGFVFDGWKVHGSVYQPGTQFGKWVDLYWDNCCRCYYWEKTYVTAQWTEITNAKSVYTLNYSITSSIVGQPAAPAQEVSSAPITPVAATPFEGHNFIGWTSPDWVAGAPVQETENEQPIMVTYYTATVTGEYSALVVVDDTENSYFSLLYRGFVDGAIFWPADVLNAPAEPTADGTPYLAEHEFLGWTPGALDWAGATVSYIYTIVDPGEGIETHQVLPYILKTKVYTLTVYAAFDQEIPTEPEIPTGIPATGDANWLVFAGIILLAGAALGGYTLVRRKDS